MKSKRFLPVCLALACLGCGAEMWGVEPLPKKEQQAISEKPCEIALENLQTAKALESKLNWNFRETTLDKVAEYFEKKLHIPVQLDHRALKAASIATDTAVTFRVKEIPASRALKQICRHLNLVYILQNEGVVITTDEELERNLVIAAYDVADLLIAGKKANVGATYPDNFQDDLLDLIRSATGNPKPGWVDDGGVGTIRAFENILIVSQTCEAHRQIENLLGSFRELLIKYDTNKEKIFSETIHVGLSPREMEIIHAFNKVTPKVDFAKQPLYEVVEQLSVETKVPIEIDSIVLRASGHEPDLPVTFKSGPSQLQDLLKHLTKSLSLEFVIRDDALVITAPSDSEDCCVNKIYPIRDLLRKSSSAPDPFGDWPGYSPDDLLDIFRSMTCNSKPGWVDDGGVGMAQFMSVIDAVVVNQTHSGHLQIEAALATIRKARSARNTPKAAPLSDTPIVRVYVIRTEEDKTPIYATDKLVELIKTEVRPDRWNEKGVLIQSFEKRIIVRHSPEIQNKIRAFLNQIHALPRFDPKAPSGIGAG